MDFDFMSIVKLLGGLALFLYGMNTMGNGLERAAGPKLEKTLEKMTGSLLRAVLIGMAVTAVIQSSSATTVMVVGFVNAGIMTLKQSVGVILGANIGTTITAQILRLDSTGTLSGSFFMQLIKPKNLAYVAVTIGIVILMLAHKKRTKDKAEILVGFGILFIGMATMEAAVEPLRDLPQFAEMFATISNPFLGVLVGASVTAIIQSSSASVGILQALSTTGSVTYAAAIPIILGQNIGTCITAFLSSIGASKNARRAAMIHFYFNLFGSLIFLAGIYSVNAMLHFSFWDIAINKGGIANFHTIFNIINTLLFLPFSGMLVKLAERTISADADKNDPLAKLEPRFIATPSIAFEQCHKCICEMGTTAKENFELSIAPLLENTQPQTTNFSENEAFLDRAEVAIGKYLLSLQSNLPAGGRQMHAEMMHSLSDFEKIGDYAQNIFDNVTTFLETDGKFSESATEELRIMAQAVSELLDLTNEAYKSRVATSARSIEPVEEIVDILKGQLKNRHIERLNQGACTVANGIIYLDIIHDLEKIGDHCSNIAIYVIQLCEGASQFDTHSYAKSGLKNTPLFQEQMNFYEKKYLDKLGILVP